MRFVYNDVAGSSLDRLSALSDGVFAFAMTLLVLDLHVPRVDGIHSEHDLWLALLAIWPRFTTYLMSFMTLGIFWVGQQTQLSFYDRVNRNYTWIQIGFLAVVAIVPFSTALLSEFITYRIALLVYWFNLFLLGSALFFGMAYAIRAGLTKEGMSDQLRTLFARRVLVSQGLYAFGALLCIFNTYWSIGFIILVQLNYLLAPKIPVLRDV